MVNLLLVGVPNVPIVLAFWLVQKFKVQVLKVKT